MNIARAITVLRDHGISGTIRKLGIKRMTQLRERGAADSANAVKYWKKMMRLQSRLNRGDDRVRYLRGENWTNGIGHIALLDFFAKRKLLGLNESRYTIITQPKYVANPYFLSLWHQYFDVRYFTSEPTLPPNIELYEDWPMLLEFKGKWLPLDIAVDRVNAEWRVKKNVPLLPLVSMPPADIARGWEHIRKLGVRKTWFVTLHARQFGTYGDVESVRNIANIRTYWTAVKRINEAGGAVIRIGAGRAVPVDGLIDLGGSPDWLDMFLISQCRFFLGCNSGPAVAACTFGVPTLLVNFAPRNSIFPHAVTILRKHVRKDGKEVDFYNPVGREWNKTRLAEQGWTSFDNTEAEITGAVERMLDNEYQSHCIGLRRSGRHLRSVPVEPAPPEAV